MKSEIILESLLQRVCYRTASYCVENIVPTDKMQRFMEYAQSTVDMRKKGTNVSNKSHALIDRLVFLHYTEVGNNGLQVIQNTIRA